MLVGGGPRTSEYDYEREYLKSQNVMISVTSLDENLGPNVPPDSYVSFLADIPLGCEGRWVTDAAEWPTDILTTGGLVDPVDPMFQVDGTPVTPPGVKVPGDGFEDTIESDLHFFTADYGIVEDPYVEIPLLRFFEFHCWVDGPHIFTFYNKIEPLVLPDPDVTNNWWKATMNVFATPNADVEVVSWTAPAAVYGIVGAPETIMVEEEKHNWGPQDTESFARWTAAPAGPFTAVWELSGTDTLEWWVPLPVSVPVPLGRNLRITCTDPGGPWPLSLVNDESLAFRDPLTQDPMVDPDLGNNIRAIDIDVYCEALEGPDKQVIDIKFDEGFSYPEEGAALHLHPGLEMAPVFFTVASENQPISVTSIEYNAGPGEPANAQVSFYADIPFYCEGRWRIDGNNPMDILTIDGDPFAYPLSPAQFGTEVPPTSDKVPGAPEDPYLHFESDLHLQTSDYGIREYVGVQVPIRRFFEIHCFEPGQFMFVFCNKAEATDVGDPNYANNLHCEEIWVDALGGDWDTDGTPDFADNCPFTSNPGQLDGDGDGYGDDCDNCPATHNPCQQDWDGDGVPGTQPPDFATWGGDACDDSDGDSYGLGSGAGHLGDDVELGMGTDPDDGCADDDTFLNERGPAYGEPLSPWGPDFNDNGELDVGDLIMLREWWFGAYSPRNDLNANGIQDIADLILMRTYWFGHDWCPVG